MISQLLKSIAILATATTLSAHADSCGNNNGTDLNNVVMTSYVAYNMSPSSFSFKKLTQDKETTRNQYQILYEGNVFRINLVGGDGGFIADLGAGSCNRITEIVQEQSPKRIYGSTSLPERAQPIAFLEESGVTHWATTSPNYITAKFDHCYIEVHSDYEGDTVTALFHVKQLVADQKVVINEINVISQSDGHR